mmetsp:Transcript_15415/g.24414  ORF Transcript_15415/g.24414 Transcript_15415/m.24414 type:complete len:327 (+) Transcript_15415:78-1058(+)
MGNTITTWYVEYLYGKGCPTNGKRVIIREDFEEKALRKLSYKKKKALAKSLGIPHPKRKPTEEDEKEFSVMARAAAFKGEQVDHSAWDEILKACIGRATLNGVETNTFDYKKLVDDGVLLGKFDNYVKSLGDPKFEDLAVNQQMALLINAYNALAVNTMLKSMREGKEVKSILDLNTKEAKVWDQPAGKLCGSETTLSEVEHKYLRAKWFEPRLHACIVCASVSCPDLRGEAFRGDFSLDTQMTDQMRLWLANPKKGFQIKEEKGGSLSIRVSSIFNWFSGDFKPSVVGFMKNYLAEEVVHKLKKVKKPKEYMNYDWSINAPPTTT